MTIIDDNGNFISQTIFGEGKRESDKDLDDKALKLYLEAVELGSRDNYNAIGDIYWRSQKEGDKLVAIDWYRKATEDGYPYSQYKLAIALLAFDRKKYLYESIGLLKKAYYNKIIKCDEAKIPLRDALDEYGAQLYYKTKGSIIEEKWLKCLIEAEELGSKQNLFLIADTIQKKLHLCMYVKSLVMQEPVLKYWQKKWYETLLKATDYGDKKALARIGHFYENGCDTYGYSFQQDLNKALDCYRKANANYEFFQLARFVAKKNYENKNYGSAYLLCKEILNIKKDPESNKMLGLLYRDGLGTDGFKQLKDNLLNSKIGNDSTSYRKFINESPGYYGNIEKAKGYFMSYYNGFQDRLSLLAIALTIGVILQIVIMPQQYYNLLHVKSVWNWPWEDFMILIVFLSAPVFIPWIFALCPEKKETLPWVLDKKEAKPRGGLFAFWNSFHDALDIKKKNILGPKIGGVFCGFLMLLIPMAIFIGLLMIPVSLPPSIDITLWAFCYSILSIPVVLLAHFVYPYHSYFVKMVVVEIIYLLTISFIGIICGNLLRSVI